MRVHDKASKSCKNECQYTKKLEMEKKYSKMIYKQKLKLKLKDNPPKLNGRLK